jgi:hypothetical protein
LFERATTWLVMHKVLLPGCSTLERYIARLRSRVEERLWRFLSRGISREQRTRLEDLLASSAGNRNSQLDQLRTGPVTASGPSMAVNSVTAALGARLGDQAAFGSSDTCDSAGRLHGKERRRPPSLALAPRTHQYARPVFVLDVGCRGKRRTAAPSQFRGRQLLTILNPVFRSTAPQTPTSPWSISTCTANAWPRSGRSVPGGWESASERTQKPTKTGGCGHLAHNTTGTHHTACRRRQIKRLCRGSLGPRITTSYPS